MTYGAPYRIAITGHRPNRMHVGVARIERQLKQVLRRLAWEARGRAVPQTPVAISALAEGSDRLFAEAALKLGMPLEVMLPFKSADYVTTFGDVATLPRMETCPESGISTPEITLASVLLPDPLPPMMACTSPL